MTKLKKINISGFKSISPKHPVEINFGDITVLLGKNGSGKSNIIGFLEMLNYIGDCNLEDFVKKEGNCELLLHNGSKYTAKIDTP